MDGHWRGAFLRMLQATLAGSGCGLSPILANRPASREVLLARLSGRVGGNDSYLVDSASGHMLV